MKNAALSAACLLAALSVPPDARGSMASLERDITAQLTPHLTPWEHKGGAWSTAGAEPPAGWYLRAEHQYDLHSLTFSVRKESAGGLVYLYTTDWRILLRSDRVVAKYAGTWGKGKPPYRHWIHYHYSAIRPIQFPAKSWQTFRLTLDGEALTLHQNGREAMKWRSPHEEWSERVRASGKFRQFDRYEYPKALPKNPLCGRDQIVVFHVMGSRAAIRDVRVVRRGDAPVLKVGVPDEAAVHRRYGAVLGPQAVEARTRATGARGRRV